MQHYVKSACKCFREEYMYKNVILKYYPHGGFVLTLASNVVAIPDLNKKKKHLNLLCGHTRNIPSTGM